MAAWATREIASMVVTTREIGSMVVEGGGAVEGDQASSAKFKKMRPPRAAAAGC